MAEGATERVVILMTPQEKKRLESRARQAKSSVGEFVRRSIDSYDPDENARLEEIEALLDTLRSSHVDALSALAEAEREIKETREYFAGRGAH